MDTGQMQHLERMSEVPRTPTINHLKAKGWKFVSEEGFINAYHTESGGSFSVLEIRAHNYNLGQSQSIADLGKEIASLLNW